MHESAKPHLEYIQNKTIDLLDIPDCLLIANEENEMLFDYTLLLVDNVYLPLMTNIVLNSFDIHDLVETSIRLKNEIEHLNSLKIIAIDTFIINKLNTVYQYALEYELYEALQNIKNFNDVLEQIKNINIL